MPYYLTKDLLSCPTTACFIAVPTSFVAFPISFQISFQALSLSLLVPATDLISLPSLLKKFPNFFITGDMALLTFLAKLLIPSAIELRVSPAFEHLHLICCSRFYFIFPNILKKAFYLCKSRGWLPEVIKCTPNFPKSLINYIIHIMESKDIEYFVF